MIDMSMLGYLAFDMQIKQDFLDNYNDEEYCSPEWEELKERVGAEHIPDIELWEVVHY